MNKSNVKILIPILSFERAGGMRVLSQLANYWNKFGYDVKIVVFHESMKPYYPLDVQVLWIDKDGRELDINTLTYDAKNSVFKRMYAILEFLKKHSEEYDIVLANHNYSTWPVWLGSKSTNFYYIQAYEPELYSSKNIRGFIQTFIAWVTYFLPITKIVNADIYKHYKNIRSNYVIPPGLDLDIYYPKELKLRNMEQIIVGCIGRIEEWKGSEDVGEAVKILHDKGYDIKFKVAFNPTKYKNHQLVHPDGDENLANFYRSLDVLVAPGHIQLGSIHYPVIEAMACNVPVITTGYYPANDENSFIVPVKRPDKIAETIELIMNDYSIAMKKATKAREHIKQFDWKIVSNKFIDIFQETMVTKNKE